MSAIAIIPGAGAARLAVGRRAPFKSGVSVVQPALPRRARAARPLAQTVSARAATSKAYICVDCGYIYDGSDGAFEKLPNSYRCPVCSAPKRRFKPYTGGTGRNDAKSMNARYDKLQRGEGLAKGGGGDNSGLLVGVAAGAVALAGLYLYLSSVYN